MKSIAQSSRRYLSRLAPRLWHGSGLKAVLRGRFERQAIDFTTPLKGAKLGTPVAETLALPDHPLTSKAGATEDLYRHYLNKTSIQSGMRQSGLITLAQGRVSYPAGVHTSPAGLVLATYPSASVLDNPKYALPQAALHLRPAHSTSAQGILLYTCWSHNFFHWTVDALPKLSLIKADAALDTVPLIMFNGAPRFVKTSLALAAPERDIVWLPSGVHSFETLIVPTNFNRSDLVAPKALHYLRTDYYPALQRALPADFAHGKRIYVSRADADVRRIANEKDIEARLSDLGFETVVMSRLTLPEQAEIFARAECIVSAHGAALVNLAFCAPGTRVLEIFQSGHKSRSYYTISGLIGLTYGFLVGERAGSDTTVDADILVDLLKQMGIANPH